ncbi:Hypothetical predicted protein [Pelobates cultripes]|uniref:Uncharacterized protein n=1 Tax=Pelobates cultripes TaxID=61616 RepID=A0AAD1WJE6_PELCU|nr:Hypothetical predicted protein [Pelobates cultripes]
MEELKRKICSFSFERYGQGHQGYNRVLLQLFGYLGHGKSSFVNSCLFALKDGPYKAVTGNEASYGGFTLTRTAYQLTNAITIVDNRGCCTMSGFEMSEVYAQLVISLCMKPRIMTNRSDRLTRVDWPKNYGEMMERLEDADMDPNFTDFIVPVFVYSSLKRVLAYEKKRDVKDFLINCRNMTGVYPIIVLTHKTSGDSSKVKKEFKNMGAEDVFSLENYTTEDHVKTLGRHDAILKFLCRAIEDINFRIKEERRDPRKERIEQFKICILNYHLDDDCRTRLTSIGVNSRSIESPCSTEHEPDLTLYEEHFSFERSQGNQGYNRVLLQLFGYAGHGKSSLTNSCLFALKNETFKMYADSKQSDGGRTLSRTTYQLTNAITIVDNRGCLTMSGFEMMEVYAQLVTLYVFIYKPVTFMACYGLLSVIFPIRQENIVPSAGFFLCSVRKHLEESEKMEIKDFLKNCRNMTGVYPIIVLTHKTSGDSSKVKKEFKNMGAEDVFSLENYTTEDHVITLGRHEAILKFLCRAIEDINFRIKEERRDPRKERIERKKFLLRYLHEQDNLRREDDQSWRHETDYD